MKIVITTPSLLGSSCKHETSYQSTQTRGRVAGSKRASRSGTCACRASLVENSSRALIGDQTQKLIAHDIGSRLDNFDYKLLISEESVSRMLPEISSFVGGMWHAIVAPFDIFSGNFLLSGLTFFFLLLMSYILLLVTPRQ